MITITRTPPSQTWTGTVFFAGGELWLASDKRIDEVRKACRSEIDRRAMARKSPPNIEGQEAANG